MENQNPKIVQRNILRKTQKRLNRLIRLLMRNAHISKRANSDRTDILDEFFARSLASKMFTNGFSVGPFGLTTSVPDLTARGSSSVAPTSTNEIETQEIDMSSICDGMYFVSFFLSLLLIS